MLYFSLLLPSLICNGLLKLASTAWLPIVKPVPMITFSMEAVGHEGKLVISVTVITMQNWILTWREAGVETWQPNKESPVLNFHAKLS